MNKEQKEEDGIRKNKKKRKGEENRNKRKKERIKSRK